MLTRIVMIRIPLCSYVRMDPDTVLGDLLNSDLQSAWRIRVQEVK